VDAFLLTLIRKCVATAVLAYLYWESVVFLLVDTILACLCTVSNSGRILAYLIRKCVVTAVLAYLCSVSDSGRIFAYFD
jgi:hypothetical protein